MSLANKPWEIDIMNTINKTHNILDEDMLANAHHTVV
jgi:hypothetical protein